MRFLSNEQIGVMTKVEVKNRIKLLDETETITKMYIKNHIKVMKKLHEDLSDFRQIIETDDLERNLVFLTMQKNKLDVELIHIQAERRVLKKHLNFNNDPINISILEKKINKANIQLEEYPTDNDVIYQYELVDNAKIVVSPQSIDNVIIPARLNRQLDYYFEE